MGMFAVARSKSESLPRVHASKRLPVLDGLRAMSIALVLLGHLNGTAGFLYTNLDRVVGDYANLGVIMFFVISGFLITTLLKEEYERFHNISLPLFYLRRILRLFPALLIFLLSLAALQQMGAIHLNAADWISAISYTVNFHRYNPWHIGHLWSLSVEEQFYLLWPAIMAVTGCRRAPWIVGCVLLLSPAARFLSLHHAPLSIFPCVADSLAAGCLLALLGDRMLRYPGYLRVLKWQYFLPASIALLFFCNWSRQYLFGIVAGLTTINLVIAMIVHRCIVIESSCPRFLSTPGITTIGVLSYSLYLWQQIFLNRNSDWPVCRFPANIVLAFIAATLSYLLVERPFNKLRGQLRRNQLRS